MLGSIVVKLISENIVRDNNMLGNIVEILVSIANRDETDVLSGLDNPMKGKIAQLWAAEMLGKDGTETSIRALENITDWSIRYHGFTFVRSVEARPILIEMLKNDELVFSACAAAESTGYSDEMRDALMALKRPTPQL